jgi:hypothetical protein
MKHLTANTFLRGGGITQLVVHLLTVPRIGGSNPGEDMAIF